MQTVETGRQERLRFRTWWKTLGGWRQMRQALQRFDESIQQELRARINGLLNRLVEQGINPRAMLYELPAVAQALAPDEQRFAASVALAMQLANRKRDAYLALRYGLSLVAQASPTPEAFRANLQALAEFDLHPGARNFYSVESCDTASPVVAQASPTPEAFRANLQALAEFGLHFDWWEIFKILRYGLPVVAQASPSPEAFLANLQALQGLVTRLKEQKICHTPTDIMWATILEYVLPLAAHASPTPEAFRAKLRAIPKLALALVEPDRFALPKYLAETPWQALRIYPIATLRQDLPTVLPPLAAFFTHLVKPMMPSTISYEVLAEFITRLEANPQLDWKKVSDDQLLQVAAESIRLRLIGEDYQLKVTPEQGHWDSKPRVVSEYGVSYTYPDYESVYVVDLHQTIELIPSGAAPRLVVKSLALDDGFLRVSGVLHVVRKAYFLQVESLYLLGAPKCLRQWFGEQSIGDLVEFDAPGIGVLGRYYPLTALGRKVVIRVYEEGQERTLAPVDTVLVRGHIDKRLRFEVLPGAEFERILLPDGLQHWTITKPEDVYSLPKATPESDTVEQLNKRNWVWRSLTNNPQELSLVLSRIRELKERFEPLLQALKKLLNIYDIVGLYTLGASLWGKNPNDLDLIVVARGYQEEHRPFELLEPQQTAEFHLPLHVRLIGLVTLARAVAGDRVENFQRIRIEAMVMYGSAVLLGGHDLFAQSKLPRQNLPKLVEHFHSATMQLQSLPGLTDLERQRKAQRWQHEIEAIEQFQDF